MKHAALSRKRELVWLSPEKIVPNDNNPRATDAFSADQLASLRRSIMAHGVLEPVIVAPYKGDTYKLIEGERRWTSARIEGVKEIPAIVVGRMDDHEELVVMFNVHAQRRGWEVAEQLNAIRRLLKSDPDKNDEELAAELGISLATFRDRRQVLNMGQRVINAIAKGDIDYYAALRTDQVSKSLAKRRPELTKKLGGEAAVRDKILMKAKNKKGITRELENIRQDVADVQAVPDEVVVAYVKSAESTLAEARSAARSLTERRAVEDIVKEVRHVSSELRKFKADLDEAPNLNDLRRALANLIDVAQDLEQRIVSVSIAKASAA